MAELGRVREARALLVAHRRELDAGLVLGRGDATGTNSIVAAAGFIHDTRAATGADSSACGRNDDCLLDRTRFTFAKIKTRDGGGFHLYALLLECHATPLIGRQSLNSLTLGFCLSFDPLTLGFCRSFDALTLGFCRSFNSLAFGFGLCFNALAFGFGRGFNTQALGKGGSFDALPFRLCLRLGLESQAPCVLCQLLAVPHLDRVQFGATFGLGEFCALQLVRLL